MSSNRLIKLVAIGVVLAVVIGAGLVLLTSQEEDKDTSPDTETPENAPMPDAISAGTETPLATASPVPTENPITPQFVVQLIRSEAWLETKRVNAAITQLCEKTNPPGLQGEVSLCYNGFVEVTAGVDLELFSEDRVDVDGDHVSVTLPSAQVRDCILDLNTSNYYNRSCSIAGILSTNCHGLDEKLPKIALQRAANQDHSELLVEAEKDAKRIIEDLLKDAGIKSVTVEIVDSDIATLSAGGTCIDYTNLIIE